MATAAAAARSVFRSSSAVRSAAARVSSQAKAPPRSPFRIGSHNSPSNIIFRCPVEMSACLESLQPFHNVTASALMTSMLTLSQRGYGWLPEAKRHRFLLDLLSFSFEALTRLDEDREAKVELGSVCFKA
ncbi:hypothetical protein OSB04_009570, partial [Centaurea solstitialis]